MIRNYFKIAWRNLRKHKIFTSINILGLAIGVASCLLILEYVSFQLSFDQFHKDVDHIYRVVNDRYQQGKLIQHGTITYSAIGKAMKDDFEEVTDQLKVEPANSVLLKYGEKKIFEEDYFFVEKNFFNFFSFPLLAGDKDNMLAAPYTIALSEDLARKIFDYRGNDFSQFLGRSIILSKDSTPSKIEGIFKNIPLNSHLHFDMLVSFQTLTSYGWKEAEYDFTDSDFWHYVKLKPQTDYQALNAKMDAFSKKHFEGDKVSGSDEKFYLQPLSKAHLYSDFEYEIGDTSSATVTWGLLIIALFIIIIAWVNYINLSTARSTVRAREVGIRKVVGSARKQLISQFMVESTLVNLVAILFGVLIIFAVQGAFNQLLGQNLSLSYLFVKGLKGFGILITVGLIIVTGLLLSGFYPAFILSSFQPILVLKGRFSSSKKGIAFRKALVIGQFSITVALMIGSMVVIDQLRYMQKKDLGFNIDRILVIKAPMLSDFDSSFIYKVNSFKEEIKKFAMVQSASSSWNVPGGELGRSFNVRRAENATDNKITTRHLGVDFDFFDVYGIHLLSGRKFEPTDHNADFDKLHNIIINEMAGRMLGFESPDAAIGQSIYRNNKKWDVIGVVANFHQKSLRYPLEPIIFLPAYSIGSEISVKIKAGDPTNTIQAIRTKYESFFPGNLFDYFFLDDHFNKQYKSDQLFEKVFGLFAGLAIIVACLGLFGLAMFATIQRTKEIGVRKVLGASLSNILLLLTGEFAKLVLISSLLAFPVAWYFMNRWLEDFTYRIHIQWWVFALSALVALLVAMLTISFQAIKTAMTNPVKSLRTE